MRRPALRPSRQSLLAARARQLRFEPTASERRLFEAVRGRRLGVSFRRQVPIGGRFIADLLAPAEKLVVEVDGGIHSRRVKADARRDEALHRLGYRVLRLDAELVMRDLPAALARIGAQLCAASATA
jgi:very-short-patch-repair endonuclease